uniref:Uncharacterized protein n=1 Tax=Tanacetum cinerariifolium TaxID=118510 RepID=A0A6L2JJY7_TANCI|nr:hypothetical protein [Tanacetum cinerariifolium]
MFVEAIILIDGRLVKLIDITLKQWLDIKFGDHRKVDKEIMEGVISTWLIRSYRKQFEEYMKIKRKLEVNRIDTDVECDPTNVEFAIWLASIFKRFDYHVPMEDDDDIRDLDDYLIQNDASYYVDEEEEIFKEIKSKLLGIPYEKPPTFKYEKFEVIKFSLGPTEEYVAIKEYD